MKTSRRERRAYLKMLKKLSPESYLEAKKEIKKIGKDLHRRHVSEVEIKLEESREAREARKIKDNNE